jgi:protein-L-isoaspartate(D-aspartate) O-methyltransferase
MKEYNLYKLIFTLTMIFSAAFLSFCEEDEFYTRKRTEMVRRQLMSSSLRRQAYVDSALPIDEGQTISQPYIVALMTQHLKLKGGEKVLEVGTGSGYQAAVLANLTDKVYSLEIRENLAKKAAETLSALDYNQSQAAKRRGEAYSSPGQHSLFSDSYSYYQKKGQAESEADSRCQFCSDDWRSPEKKGQVNSLRLPASRQDYTLPRRQRSARKLNL